MVKKLLEELCGLCYEASKTTSNDVFFNYAPHVDRVTVCYYENGWAKGGKENYILLSAEITEGNLKRGIEEVKKLLEPDWSKVAVDAKVLVSPNGIDWLNRYFAECKNGKVCVWKEGRTSWSEIGTEDWKYAKLAEE